ncbi:phosphate acyltransferase PlsX [Patulibacter sp.]|uniref:phosphate acyltransferase PlsX n=1 Tax=Patulibacter sp. TaxID=1912859 RepID=UPI002721342F|nr:phosphate acyltransferase PlsX [Patulibacter sp.]MDO9409949.1 phosphate acyltransferase PlsX [Patulibacter sp.]
MTVTVAVDTTGADLGPAEVAEGAKLAAARADVRIVLFGPEAELRAVVDGVPGVEVVDAPLSIAKAPDPALAVRQHPEASIVRAIRSVSAGDADTFVVAGATGPALAAGLMHVRRAKGIHRPALALPLPTLGDPVTLVDVGANVEARPDHLVQFGFMGAALARTVLGVPRPRVALLSNGEEPTKGTSDVVEVHRLLGERLADHPHIEWVGNVEGNDVASGAADVVVTDGFTGNVTLKVMEGVSQAVVTGVRQAATSNPVAMLGGLLLKPSLNRFKASIDPEASGGAYLLGLKSLGVVPHGRFSREGFARAIVLAAQGHDGRVTDLIHADLEAVGALRRPPASAVAAGDRDRPSE